jgi:hypothetical protein
VDTGVRAGRTRVSGGQRRTADDVFRLRDPVAVLARPIDGAIAPSPPWPGCAICAAFFLVERRLQQVGGLFVAHRPRPRDERAVGRHLVVLGALARRDDAGVERRIVEVLRQRRLTLVDDAGHALAVFALHLLVEAREDFLQARGVFARLFEMALQGVSERFGVGGPGHLGQGLDQLFLRVVRVAEFVDECVVQRAGLSHRAFSCWSSCRADTRKARTEHGSSKRGASADGENMPPALPRCGRAARR